MNDLPKSDNGNNVEVMKDKESQDKGIVLARAIFPPQLPVIPLNKKTPRPKTITMVKITRSFLCEIVFSIFGFIPSIKAPSQYLSLLFS